MTKPSTALAETGYAVPHGTDLKDWREAYGGVFPARFDALLSPIVQAPDFGMSAPYPWQMAAWEACWVPGAQVSLATCNEAQPHDTIIPTPTGPRRFGDLKQYDSVFGSDGKTYRVLYVYEHGEKDVYRITFDDGTSTLATADHLWWYLPKAGRHNGTRDKWRCFSTQEILWQQGQTATPQTSGAIPVCAPVEYKERRKFVIRPYTMGVLLGDGCMRNGASFTSADSEIVGRVQSETATTHSVKQYSKYGYAISKKRNGVANKYRDALARYGLANTLSNAKFIPEEYLRGSVRQRTDLLRGLMDTDGTISARGNHSTFCTVSQRLCADIMELTRSLGGKATMTTKTPWFRHKGERKQGQLCYIVTVRLTTICPFYLSRKVSRWKPFEKVGHKFINSIVPEGRANVRCIKTSAHDHSYLTNDYIVTHNSGKSSVFVPILAAAWASAFPGSQVVITSRSIDQITEQLWPALRGIANKYKWQASADKIQLPSVDGLPGSTIILRVTNQGDRFEGYHNRVHEDNKNNRRFCPLLMIADEAKGISEDIFLAIERCNPCVTVYVSTTGEDSGSFYESRMNASGLWTTGHTFHGKHYDFEIDWLQCPHLRVGRTRLRKEALIDRFGMNSPEVMSILLAKFFRAGEHMVFGGADIAQMRKCMSGMVPLVAGRKKGFCDFSGGGDELTFGWREGNFINPIVAWRNDTDVAPSVTADKYIRAFKAAGFDEEDARDIAGDNGGLGAQIISQLHEKKWPIVRVNPNKDPRNKADFVDRYSEMHWEFKKLVENGELSLPNDPVLLEQSAKRRYVKRNADDNKIKVEPKKAAKARSKGREPSPDRLDTVIHLCEGVERFGVEMRRLTKGLRTGSTEEWLKDRQDAALTGGGGWQGDNGM